MSKNNAKTQSLLDQITAHMLIELEQSDDFDKQTIDALNQLSSQGNLSSHTKILKIIQQKRGSNQ